MNLDVALVITIGSIAGSIIITQMWQMNYFKRENFKFNLAQQKKADGIKFKKLERDLGLKQSKKDQDVKDNDSLLELIKNLDVEKIKSLTGLVQKQDEYEDDEEEDDMINNILEYAKNNPEVANQFLKQLNIGGNQEQTTQQKYLGE